MPSITASRFIARRHRALHKEMLRCLRVLRSGATERAVHQARLAVRHVQALLRLFKSSTPVSLTHHYRQVLKTLMRALGSCRDVELLQQSVRAMAEKATGRRGYALESLGANLANIHASACVDLQADLRHWLRSGRLAAPRASEWLRGDYDARSLVTPTLAHWRRKLKRLMRPAEKRAEALHRIRAKVKVLRYALENLSDVTSVSMKELSALRRLQEVLGDLHDLQQLIRALHEEKKDVLSKQCNRKLAHREKILIHDYRVARKTLLESWRQP